MSNGLFHDTSADHPWLWLGLVLAVGIAPMLVGLGPDLVAQVAMDADPLSIDAPLRSRLTTAATGLLALIAIYWAGCTLGGATLGLISALSVGTTWCFQQSCLASGDIRPTAWATLSMAAALWAMAPFAAPPSVARRLGGWTLAAVALGVAAAIDPGLALAVTLGPLLLMIPLIGSDRRTNLASLVLAGLGAAALAAPWWDAWPQAPDLGAGLRPWQYAAVLGMVAPWTLWFIGGLLMPFVCGEGGLRRRVLLPWVWFVLVFVLFCVSGAGQPRLAISIMPAAGLLIGWVWADHQQLAERGERAPWAWWLSVPHWAGLILASLAVGPVLLGQEWMIGRGWLDRAWIDPIPSETVIVGSVVLTAIAVIGAWQHVRWRPRGAAIATALWSVVLLGMMWAA